MSFQSLLNSRYGACVNVIVLPVLRSVLVVSAVRGK
jgi:hypothetical protein